MPGVPSIVRCKTVYTLLSHVDHFAHFFKGVLIVCTCPAFHTSPCPT